MTTLQARCQSRNQTRSDYCRSGIFLQFYRHKYHQLCHIL